jgi:hypothetical protein
MEQPVGCKRYFMGGGYATHLVIPVRQDMDYFLA